MENLSNPITSEWNSTIPLDKSWQMRLGVLDIIAGRQQDTFDFLETQENLGDDLTALKDVTQMWGKCNKLPVRESGTLLRFLQFTAWRHNLDLSFKTTGTLQQRPITTNPSITTRRQKELLKLDKGTSQWASAAVLNGDEERLKNPPYKLEQTYEAWEHWHQMRDTGALWVPRKDATIEKQSVTFLELIAGKQATFEAEQAEDFCFAYVFGYITVEEARKQWPNLEGHESNRLEEMPTMISNAERHEVVTSQDHRVIQALGMWGCVNEVEVDFAHPNATCKSWPRFAEFLKLAQAS